MKERDEFRRLQDVMKSKDQMIMQKEEKAAKVLKDGERLARRQAELEITIRELRKVLKEREEELRDHTNVVTESNAIINQQKDRIEQLEAHESAFAGTSIIILTEKAS
jgi:septal ring factor EnvC (AmiA/AmiB activator)